MINPTFLRFSRETSFRFERSFELHATLRRTLRPPPRPRRARLRGEGLSPHVDARPCRRERHVAGGDVLLRPRQRGPAGAHPGALLYAVARRRAARDPQEKLHAFIRHHVEFFADHMAEMKVLSHEASPKSVSSIKRRYVDLLESILKAAAPEQNATHRSATTCILFGMMNWIYNWYKPDGEIDPARLADLMASIFLGGFVETHSEAN